MSDRLENLYAAIAARPAGAMVGWRAGEGVANATFLARVRAWYALLRAQPGSAFALYLDDSIEFGAALLGAWHAQKTVWLSADTLATTCASLRASVDGFLGQFPAALQPLQPGAAAPTLADAELRKPLRSDLPAVVVFTSGSTGAAQAIPKKLAQLANEVETLEALFGRAAGAAAVLATVSHQHIYGLLFKLLWPLSASRPLHAISVVHAEELAQVMAAGPCLLVASPAYLKRLPPLLDWRGAARNVRTVFSSGGPLALETAFAVGAMLGEIPVEVYGSSETGGVAWRQRSRCGDDSWLPFPTVQWRLQARGGTLEVRSPHLQDERWFPLADRAAPVGGTRFALLGRSDRIVKIEEKRISLNALEAALLATGLADEACLILCPSGAADRERLAAFIVPSAPGRVVLDAEGRAALTARLRAALAASVEAVALPRRWRYLARLPCDAQGKTSAASLLALLDEPPLRPTRE